MDNPPDPGDESSPRPRSELMRPEERCDVLVVGAGPAGGLAGLLCARRGMQTILVDKQPFPRHKVCGCCLNGRAVDSLQRNGVWSRIAARGAVRLTAVRIILRGSELRIPLPESWAVSRSLLDQILVDAAVDSGCTFLPSTTARIDASLLRRTQSERAQRGPSGNGSDADRREVELTTGARRWIVSAGTVLVCDGLGHPSLIGSERFHSDVRPDSRVGLGAVLKPDGDRDPLPTAGRQGEICMLVGRSGYVGMAPLEDGRLNLAAAIDPAFLQAHSDPADAIRALFQEARVTPPTELAGLTFRGTPALTRESRSVAGDSLLLLGDAAGYVEPFTGEGIAWALRSADLAVPLLDEACRSQNRRQLATQWQSVFEEHVRSKRLICQLLSAGLRTPWMLKPMLLVCRLFPFVARQLVVQMNSTNS